MRPQGNEAEGQGGSCREAHGAVKANWQAMGAHESPQTGCAMRRLLNPQAAHPQAVLGAGAAVGQGLTAAVWKALDAERDDGWGKARGSGRMMVDLSGCCACPQCAGTRQCDDTTWHQGEGCSACQRAHEHARRALTGAAVRGVGWPDLGAQLEGGVDVHAGDGGGAGAGRLALTYERLSGREGGRERVPVGRGGIGPVRAPVQGLSSAIGKWHIAARQLAAPVKPLQIGCEIVQPQLVRPASTDHAQRQSVSTQNARGYEPHAAPVHSRHPVQQGHTQRACGTTGGRLQSSAGAAALHSFCDRGCGV